MLKPPLTYYKTGFKRKFLSNFKIQIWYGELQSAKILLLPHKMRISFGAIKLLFFPHIAIAS